MHWFKILLLVLLFVGMMLNFVSSGKGKRTKEVEPAAEFVGGLVQCFFIVGVYFWL